MRCERYDVVVAGCGVAGLSAAVAAAEGGARVAVLERAPREERGGQSRYTEAYLRMKSEDEVTDDFEAHLAENGSGCRGPRPGRGTRAAAGRAGRLRRARSASPTPTSIADLRGAGRARRSLG